MTKLNNIIKDLLDKFVGGEIYFDKLDEVLRSSENLDIIQKLFSPLKDNNVVVSGKFGHYILQLFDSGLISVNSIIVANGGLRSGKIKSFKSRNLIKNENYIFVDDSLYSGTTRNRVAEFIEKFNCKVSLSRVIYDGSIKKDDSVISLYRYHCNFSD